MTEQQTVLLVETAPGELIDKLTILDIKNERITDENRRANVQKELEILTATRNKHLPQTDELKQLYQELKEVNLEIWDYSDAIRELGERGDFGAEFARVSWVIHTANDRRAAIKKKINLLYNSLIVEEKSYKHWK